MAKLTDMFGRPHSGLMPMVVVGIVTDNADPEDTGRVRLRFPWLDDEYESWWVRVAQRWRVVEWARRNHVFAFTQEPATIIASPAAFVGLEIPNENRQLVTLGEILKSRAYDDMASPLTLAP